MLTFINVQVGFFNLSYLQEIENCPQSRSWDVLERRRLMNTICTFVQTSIQSQNYMICPSAMTLK